MSEGKPPGLEIGPDVDSRSEMVRRMLDRMNQGSPHAGALNIHTLEIGKARSVLKIPYAEHLVGDPATGVIAGGVVTTLLDHACGQAVHMAMDSFVVIATLDLRIDYMRPAEPRLDLYAAAHCFKITRSVAFVRAVAYDRDPEDPVAAAQAAFMLDSSRLSPAELAKSLGAPEAVQTPPGAGA